MPTEKVTQSIVGIIRSLPPMAVTILSLPLSLPLTVWLMGQLVDDRSLEMTGSLITTLNNPLGVALLYGASALGCASILGRSIWHIVAIFEAHHNTLLDLFKNITELHTILKLIRGDLIDMRRAINVAKRREDPKNGREPHERDEHN